MWDVISLQILSPIDSALNKAHRFLQMGWALVAGWERALCEVSSMCSTVSSMSVVRHMVLLAAAVERLSIVAKPASVAHIEAAQ